jgi:hypothetical protein
MLPNCVSCSQLTILKENSWQLGRKMSHLSVQTQFDSFFINTTYVIKYSITCINHSVQNLLSSRLLSKNLKIRIHKTIILPVVLYGCEICL